MHKENQSIGVAFDLADWPTVGELEDYQLKLREAVTAFNGSLTDARLYAMIHVAAFSSGLASNWQCERMPDPLPTDPRSADGVAITYSGSAINDQIKKWTEIPFV